MFQFPQTLDPSGQNKENRKPGSLPEEVELDPPSRDLLQRLLEIDPKKRLRSLRSLTTIAFFKGYDFQKVKMKSVGLSLFLEFYLFSKYVDVYKLFWKFYEY